MTNKTAKKRDGAESKPSVGYKKPPVKHRFQKGRSGNPHGRPRKKVGVPTPQNLNELEAVILEEVYRPVSIRDGNKVIQLSTIRAAMRGLGVAAIKGDRHSQLALKAITDTIVTKRQAEKQQLFEAAAEYKWGWERRFKECDRLDQPRPDPVPHPDDIQIDVLMGEARFVGPQDLLHKAFWDEKQGLKKKALENIEFLKELAKTAPKACDGFKVTIAFWDQFHRFLDYHYPDEMTRRSLLYDPSNLGEPPEPPKYPDPTRRPVRATKAVARRRKVGSGG